MPLRWLCNILLKAELDAARMQSILAMNKLGYHPTSNVNANRCVLELAEAFEDWVGARPFEDWVDSFLWDRAHEYAAGMLRDSYSRATGACR